MVIVRAIILVCILWVCWINVQAQVPGRFIVGPRIGLNISNVNVQASNTVPGLSAGLTATYGLQEFSGITIDALFSQEGYETSTSEVNYGYLQLPITYNTFIGTSDQLFRPKIYAGFSPGFLLQAKVNDIDFLDQNNTFAFNFIGGLGFNYRVASRIWIQTDIRAFIGLTEIEINGTRNDPLKNRTLQFSLALSYGI